MPEWLKLAADRLVDTILSLNYLLGLLTAVIGAFVGHRVKLPKLYVSGGGGGSGNSIDGQPFSYEGLYIANSGRFFGYPFSRNTLRNASATLYDPTEKRHVGGRLLWQVGRDENEKIDLESGSSAQLLVCGVYSQRVHKYSGKNPREIERSPTLIELGESKKFEIHLTDQIGRKFKFPIKIRCREARNTLQKVQVSVSVKVNFSDRLDEFHSAFRDMVRAFTRPSY